MKLNATFAQITNKTVQMNSIDQYFLQQTIELAIENVKSGKGGPFAAIITKEDKMIAKGTNTVTSSHDPTAHAEISAIRNCCNVLNDFQLEGCTLYSSCEPCPMCLGAIYWSRLKRLIFAADKSQAERAGFDDAFIYKEIILPYHQRKLITERIVLQQDNLPFEAWMNTNTKIEY
jgi:guanine deaminase